MIVSCSILLYSYASSPFQAPAQWIMPMAWCSLPDTLVMPNNGVRVRFRVMMNNFLYFFFFFCSG